MRLLKQKMIFVLITMLSFTWQANAQVTVGHDSAPQSYSILELSTQTTKGGLRMPHINNAQKATLTTSFGSDAAAKGLTIFNTDTQCIEYWNGTIWVSTCDKCAAVGSVSFVSPTGNVTYTKSTGLKAIVVSATDAATYDWFLAGSSTAVKSSAENYYNFNTDVAVGTYTLRVVAKNTSCTSTTPTEATITITIVADTGDCLPLGNASFVTPTVGATTASYAQGSGGGIQPIIALADNSTNFTWTSQLLPSGPTISVGGNTAVYNFNTNQALGTYRVKVVVTNATSSCTTTAAKDTATIDVAIIRPPLDPLKEGKINGISCFDVYLTESPTCGLFVNRTNSFASGFTFPFTFASTETYSSLKFYTEDPDGLLSPAPAQGSTATPYSITFRNDIRQFIQTNGTKTLTLIATYENSAGNTVRVELAIVVKDCECGVPLGPSPLDPEVKGIITGETCFDVWMTDYPIGDKCAPLAARYNSFAGPKYAFPYNLVTNPASSDSSTPISPVRYYTDDPNGLLVATQLQGASMSPYNITFRDDIRQFIQTNGTKTLTVIAVYSNGTTDVRAELTVTVQDCACGCPARSATSVTPSGWLMFMCHNLGSDTSIDPSEFNHIRVTDSANHTKEGTTGDIYQWGRQKDGHQLPAWGINGSTRVINAWDPALTVTDGVVQNPNKRNFIKTNPVLFAGPPIIPPTPNNDWTNKITALFDTWGTSAGIRDNDTKGRYDPCPTGWKIPTIRQWESIFFLDGSAVPNYTLFTAATANTWVLNQQWVDISMVSRGLLVDVYMMKVGNYLYLPLAGYSPSVRSQSQGVQNMGGESEHTGNYWSSSSAYQTATSPVYALLMSLEGIGSGSVLSTRLGNQRSIGYSVRCVRE